MTSNVSVRRSEPDDADTVTALLADDLVLARQRFGHFNVASIIELGYLSVTAVNEDDEIVAFAAFNDTPSTGSASKWVEWARENVTELSHLKSGSTLWLNLFVSEPSFGKVCIDSILQTVFTTLPEVDDCVFQLPNNSPLFAPLSDMFNPCSAPATPPPGPAVSPPRAFYVCRRNQYIPDLHVRSAKVEDHDDLVPIFNEQSEVLTDLYGEFFLAELIESQDFQSKALVGEVGDTAVGLLAATKEVQLDVLQQCFELDPYNKLVKRTPEQEAAESKAQKEKEMTASDWLQQLQLHADDIRQVFDDLIVSTEASGSGEPPIQVSDLVKELNRKGMEWGFLGPADPSGRPRDLGTCMAWDVRLSSDTITREELNEIIEDFADRLHFRRRLAGLQQWYNNEAIHQEILRAYEDVQQQQDMLKNEIGEEQSSAPKAPKEGTKERKGSTEEKQGGKEDKQEEEEEEEEEEADPTRNRLSLVALGRRLMDRVRDDTDNGMVFVDELRRLMGDDWGGAPRFSDYENAEVESMEAGESDIQLPDEGELGWVSKEELESALVVFEGEVQDLFAVRVVVSGPPGSGCEEVAKHTAAALGVACVNATEVQAAARQRYDELIEAQKARGARGEGSEEESDEEEEEALNAEDEAVLAMFAEGAEGGGAAPLVARLREEDCEKGCVIYGITGAPGLSKDAVAAFSSTLSKHRQHIHVALHVDTNQSVCRERLEPAVGASWSELISAWEDANAKDAPLEAIHALCRRDVHGEDLDALLKEAEALLQWEHLTGNNFRQLESTDKEAAPEDAPHLHFMPGEVESNAFAITLFCVDESFESRSRDFLVSAFAAFPDKEYCILTLPHDSNETALLQHFVQVPPSPSNTFSHVLYLVHRASLLAPRQMTVRRADYTDRAGILRLLQGMPEAGGIMREIGEAEEEAETTTLEDNPATVAVVGVVQGQIVGVAVLSKAYSTEAHMKSLSAAFDIDRLVQLRYHPHYNCVSLVHFSMNPIFQQHSRYLLRRACQLYKKTAVFYRLAPECSAPTIIDDFIQVRPRTLPALRPSEQKVEDGEEGKDSASELSVDPRKQVYSLYFLTSKLFSEPKVVVNSRVIVVGASDTGLSFLQSLCLVPYLKFTHLTLVSPNGLPPHAPTTLPGRLASVPRSDAATSCQFTEKQPWPAQPSLSPAPFMPLNEFSASYLSQLNLPCRVRVIAGAVTEIDRESRALVLSDGSLLPYDEVVLTPGLSEPTKHRLDIPTDPTFDGDVAQLPNETFPIHFLTHHGAVPLLEKTTAEAVDDPLQSASSNKQPDVFVWGNGLRALTAIAALVERGIDGKRIVFAHSGPAYKGLRTAYLESKEGAEVASTMEGAVQDGMEDVGVTVLPDVELEGLEEVSAREAVLSLKKADGVSITLNARLVVCADTPDVDGRFFAAVNGCGLVYDGRLVVDHRFRTADGAILAGGTVTKFSRRYKAARRMEAFQSVELGAALAASLLRDLDPLEAESGSEWEGAPGPAALPRFHQPRRTVAVLPGGYIHFHSELPSVAFSDVGGVLTTRVGEEGVVLKRFCALAIDRFERLAGITYLGMDKVEYDNLSMLVGRHESFLNKLRSDYSAGLIKDFIEHFRGDWAVAQYHDRFASLVSEITEALSGLRDKNPEETVAKLQETMKGLSENGAKDSLFAKCRSDAVGPAGRALQPTTRRTMEIHLIQFLREYKDVLPMYFLPTASLSSARQ